MSEERGIIAAPGAASNRMLQTVSLGLPILVAGVVKGSYDLALWRWFKRLPPEPGSGADR